MDGGSPQTAPGPDWDVAPTRADLAHMSPGRQWYWAARETAVQTLFSEGAGVAIQEHACGLSPEKTARAAHLVGILGSAEASLLHTAPRTGQEQATPDLLRSARAQLEQVRGPWISLGDTSREDDPLDAFSQAAQRLDSGRPFDRESLVGTVRAMEMSALSVGADVHHPDPHPGSAEAARLGIFAARRLTGDVLESNPELKTTLGHAHVAGTRDVLAHLGEEERVRNRVPVGALARHFGAHPAATMGRLVGLGLLDEEHPDMAPFRSEDGRMFPDRVMAGLAAHAACPPGDVLEGAADRLAEMGRLDRAGRTTIQAARHAARGSDRDDALAAGHVFDRLQEVAVASGPDREVDMLSIASAAQVWQARQTRTRTASRDIGRAAAR